MPAQIKRLALVFAVLIGCFLLIRALLMPDTFGQYGHYRGQALEDNRNHEVKYLGEKFCLECHEEYGDMKSSDLHAEISCETCHGPGWKHVEEPEPENITLPEGRAFCGLCHSLNAARLTDNVAQVDLKEHNTGKQCLDCHNPHAPWQ